MARLPPHWTIQKNKEGELDFVKNRMNDGDTLFVYEIAEGESSRAYPRVIVELNDVSGSKHYAITFEEGINDYNRMEKKFSSFEQAKEEAHLKAQELSSSTNTEKVTGVPIRVEETGGLTAEEGEYNLHLVGDRYNIRAGERADWTGTIDTNVVKGEYMDDAAEDLRDLVGEQMEIEVEYIPAEEYAQNYNKIIGYSSVH